jgi:hypothetical protein
MIVMSNLKVHGKKYLYLTINFLHRVAHFWFPSQTWRRSKLAKKRGWSMSSPVIDNIAQKNSTSAHVWCWYIDLSHLAVVNYWSAWSYYERNCQGRLGEKESLINLISLLWMFQSCWHIRRLLRMLVTPWYIQSLKKCTRIFGTFSKSNVGQSSRTMQNKHPSHSMTETFQRDLNHLIH